MTTPIGLDLSLTNTAICAPGERAIAFVNPPGGQAVVRVSKEGDPYTFTRLAQGAKIPTPERWRRVVMRLMEFINGCSPKGDAAVYIEGYAWGAVRSPHSNPYELGGIVRYELANADVPWCAVNPTTLKKFVTGKGNAPKSLVLKEALRRWAIDLNDDNEADALGLAKLGEAFGRYSKGDESGLIKPQIEVMKTLAKKGETLWA